MKGHQHYQEAMLSVEEALDRILSLCTPLNAEQKTILQAFGHVLGEDVISSMNVPQLDNSAMDGYAVQAKSLVGASKSSPVSLDVVGNVAAGQIPDAVVRSGTAVRIMTGAPLPLGADAVVPFEDTDEGFPECSNVGGNRIAIFTQIDSANYVRAAGRDIKRGEQVFKKGTLLRSSHVGVLASLGIDAVKIVRSPRVAILATGDELVEPGEELTPGRIYNSNSFGIASAVVRSGGEPRILGIASDNIETLSAKIDEGLTSDLLITSAGVSKGDYDIVKDVLAKRGRMEFWSVRMRPAKPLAFGTLISSDGRDVPHLGLPGNPVSALVAFEQFGRPAILKMMGKTDLERPTIEAVLEDPIYNGDGRRVYARVVVTKGNGIYYAKLTGHQDSNLLSSMAKANGLAICPEENRVKDVGEVVKVQMIDWPEGVF